MNTDIITRDITPPTQVERYLDFLVKYHRMLAAGHVELMGDTAQVITKATAASKRKAAGTGSGTGSGTNSIVRFLRKGGQ